jgi:hypothetical protein
MITDLNEILVEWSYRTSDGKPDVKNSAKLIILESVLNDFGWSREARAELLSTLMEGDEWWSKMTPDQQATYIKKHPNSQKAQDAKEKEKEDDEEKKDDEPKDKKEKPKNVNQVSGDEKEDDNKVKNEVLKYGYNGMEDATGRKPAPGTPGSAFNEITSGEGVKILEGNENLSEEELAAKIFDQFGDSALGQEQNKTAGIPVPQKFTDNIKAAKKKEKDYIEQELGPKPSKAKEPKKLKEWEKKRKKLLKEDPTAISNANEVKKAEQERATYTKCVVAARSARQKHKNSVRRASALQEKGLLGKETKIKTFYGANESLSAQVKVIEEAKSKGAKVLLPNGKEVNPDDAIKFIKAGGGGANPSDTATFVVDENGNVMLQFHSDKIATSDIQDNSTLAKESDNYLNFLAKQNMSENDREEAKRIVNKYDVEMQKIEENYNDQATPIAKRLQELPLDEQVDIIEKDTGTLKKNLKFALLAADGGVKSQYKKYMPDGKERFDELSIEEQYEIIRKITADGNAKPNDTKIVNKVASAVEKANSGIDGLDVKGNLAKQRKKVVDLQRKRVEELNKIKVDVDGVEKGAGEIMEAEESIRGFHLSMMDEHDYDEDDSDESRRMKGIMNASLDINMGGNIVDGEVMKKCMNVKNTTEMKQKFALREPEGKDDKGRDARYTYDEKDNITGKKVHVYALDDEGKEIEIGFKTYRSKAGADGKTNNTMQYSKQMKDCFETGEKP